MVTESIESKISASAETLITLSEKARLRGDMARSEHLLIQAWLAYEADIEDGAAAGGSRQIEPALNAA